MRHAGVFLDGKIPPQSHRLHALDALGGAHHLADGFGLRRGQRFLAGMFREHAGVKGRHFRHRRRRRLAQRLGEQGIERDGGLQLGQHAIALGGEFLRLELGQHQERRGHRMPLAEVPQMLAPPAGDRGVKFPLLGEGAEFVIRFVPPFRAELEVFLHRLRREQGAFFLGEEIRHRLLFVRQIGFIGEIGRGALRLAEERFVRRLLAGGEDAVKAVVIGGGDGIELVVVAAGAGHRHRLEAAEGHVDAIVDDVGLVVEEAAAEGEEAHRREVARVVPAQRLIGGELGEDELVVGQVVVEGAHHPVAVGVAVGVAALFLEDVAFGIRIARDVQPVARPAFAEPRIGQEPVHELFQGLRIGIGGEGFDLLGGGRQAEEIEIRAADERRPVRLGRKRQPFFREGGEDEGVQRLPDARGVGQRGRGGSLHRLEGPMRADLLGGGGFTPDGQRRDQRQRGQQRGGHAGPDIGKKRRHQKKAIRAP